jgi:hypothetical protein
VKRDKAATGSLPAQIQVRWPWQYRSLWPCRTLRAEVRLVERPNLSVDGP